MPLEWDLLEAQDVTAAWQHALAASSHATFFHTPTWAELLQTTLPGWQADPIAIEFTDGMLGVLPMMRRTDSEHRESMAPYVYGGPLFSGAPSEFHLEEISKIPRWYPDIVLYSNPFSPFEWYQDGLVRWRIHTHVLDLTPGFAAIFSGFRQTVRRHCRAAQRHGIEVSVAQNLDQVDQYYDAYVESLRRWGDQASSNYPAESFHGLFELQRSAQGVRLWVAELGGRVISGLTELYQGDHSVVWLSATRSEGLPLHASPFIHMSVVEAACAEGFRWFDFNPSGSLKGVEWFKEGFGTERRRFDMYASPGATRPPIDHPAESGGEQCQTA